MKFQNKVFATLPLSVVAFSGWLEVLGLLEPGNSELKVKRFKNALIKIKTNRCHSCYGIH